MLNQKQKSIIRDQLPRRAYLMLIKICFAMGVAIIFLCLGLLAIRFVLDEPLIPQQTNSSVLGNNSADSLPFDTDYMTFTYSLGVGGWQTNIVKIAARAPFARRNRATVPEERASPYSGKTPC